jgi:hypothetical protein
MYRNSSVFIVLSGPSLTTFDLSLLSRRGIVTFGVNNSPAVVRPNLWTHVDPQLKFHEAIWRDPAILKFTPVVERGKKVSYNRTLRRKIGIDEYGRAKFEDLKSSSGQPVKALDMPRVVGYRRAPCFDPDKYLSEPLVNWGNSKKSANQNNGPRTLNVMFAILKIAYSLGFRDVYLLGCDFAMSPEQPYAFNELKAARRVPDEGEPERERSDAAGAVRGCNNAYRVMDGMFGELQERFLPAGFRVWNCFEDSGLTAFPFMAYEQAIELASGDVPQDPLDCAGWYYY